MNVFIDLGRQMWTMLSTTFRDVMREHHAAYHADKAKVWAGFLSAAAGAMARDLGKDDAVAVLKGIVGVTEATPLQSAQETPVRPNPRWCSTHGGHEYGPCPECPTVNQRTDQ